jgi:hypothetical protein
VSSAVPIGLLVAEVADGGLAERQLLLPVVELLFAVVRALAAVVEVQLPQADLVVRS